MQEIYTWYDFWAKLSVREKLRWPKLFCRKVYLATQSSELWQACFVNRVVGEMQMNEGEKGTSSEKGKSRQTATGRMYYVL